MRWSGGILGRPPRVAVMGAPRSGTNFVRYLLERNYRCRVLYHSYGWKHAPVPIFDAHAPVRYPRLPIVYVSKNPLSFAASLHAYFVASGLNIRAAPEWTHFLREPITLFDASLDRSPQMRFANPVQYWNFVYWNLSTLPAARFSCHGLRYEDALIDPESATARVASLLGLARLSRPFDVPAFTMSRMGEGRARGGNPYETERPFDREAHTKARALDRFTPEDVEFVSSQADAAVVERLGYPPDLVGGAAR